MFSDTLLRTERPFYWFWPVNLLEEVYSRARIRHCGKADLQTMTTWGYVRVSTTRQAEEGESLEMQQRIIAGYAQMDGMQLHHVLIERGVSGSIPLEQRPEGGMLLRKIQPGDAIITAKLDRAFRNAVDALNVLGQLRQRKISPIW